MKFILFLLIPTYIYSQVDKALDDKYREDQFVITFAYNDFKNESSEFKQNSFSPNISMGFLRDMPISKNRKYALALGPTVTFNSFNQNLYINKEDNLFVYKFLNLSDGTTKRNKFTYYSVDLPIELRWRDSTPTNTNFFRIYTGLKTSYIFHTFSRYIGELGKIEYSELKNISKIQYGLTISIGYSSINLYAYYGLSNLFNKNIRPANNIPLGDISIVKFGISLYIL